VETLALRQLSNACARFAAMMSLKKLSYRKLPRCAMGSARMPTRAPCFSSVLTRVNHLLSWMEITGWWRQS
jgi:hypothetical protein